MVRFRLSEWLLLAWLAARWVGMWWLLRDIPGLILVSTVATWCAVVVFPLIIIVSLSGGWPLRRFFTAMWELGRRYRELGRPHNSLTTAVIITEVFAFTRALIYTVGGDAAASLMEYSSITFALVCAGLLAYSAEVLALRDGQEPRKPG